MELFKSLNNINRNKTELWVDGHAKDLAAISEFTTLKELWLYRLPKRNIPILTALELPKLEVLSSRLASFPNLNCISHFHTLKTLAVWQCSKLQSLEGLDSISKLRELTLMQNGPLTSLEPIASLEHLEKLVIIGGVFKNQKLSSFEPIARLGKLFKVLDLTGVKLENPDLKPLTHIPEPDEFGLSVRFYPLEQVAMLAAAYPRWGSQLLKLHDNSFSRCKKCGGPRKMLLKARTRDLCPKCDSVKLEKFLADFQLLVEEHKR